MDTRASPVETTNKSRHHYNFSLRTMAELETHAKTMDKHYDLCQEAWCVGEAEKFASEKFLAFDLLSDDSVS